MLDPLFTFFDIDQTEFYNILKVERKTYKHVLINSLSFQNRRTRITLPENKISDHDIHTLDLGLYAEVAILPTDDDNLPIEGQREMYLTSVQGDYTAWVHVESGIFLNIDFADTAILSFSIAVYEV